MKSIEKYREMIFDAVKLKGLGGDNAPFDRVIVEIIEDAKNKCLGAVLDTFGKDSIAYHLSVVKFSEIEPPKE